MAVKLRGLVDDALWRRLVRRYRAEWGVGLMVVGPEGAAVFGGALHSGEAACRRANAMAVDEARRWGEATVVSCACGKLLWAAPVMHNEEVLGGLVAGIAERTLFRAGAPALDMRRACAGLRELAEQENLANASALALGRRRYEREQTRAYALHAAKDRGHDVIRELYLREEPALFSAIRAGDRSHAREILNRVLMVMCHHAGGRLDLVKSLFLELVVNMTRTAVEAGGDAEALLGANYAGMTGLAGVGSEEELSDWLTATLERIMDGVERHRKRGPGHALFDALAYMERHRGEKIGRDDAARAAHLSPSHFSWLVRKETGSTFTEWLNRMRVDRAAELLAQGDESLASVALACGFEDQSYFTKVFKRYRNCSPGQFRQTLRQPPPPATRPEPEGTEKGKKRKRG